MKCAVFIASILLFLACGNESVNNEPLFFLPEDTASESAIPANDSVAGSENSGDAQGGAMMAPSQQPQNADFSGISCDSTGFSARDQLAGNILRASVQSRRWSKW